MQISVSLRLLQIFVIQGANMRQISKTTECTILTLMGNTLENIQDSEKSEEASARKYDQVSEIQKNSKLLQKPVTALSTNQCLVFYFVNKFLIHG